MPIGRTLFITLLALLLNGATPAPALAKVKARKSSSITLQPSNHHQFPMFSVRYEGSISDVNSAWGSLAYGGYNSAIITNFSLGYRRYVSGNFSSGWFLSPFLSSTKISAGSRGATFNALCATYGGKHIFRSGFTLEGELGAGVSSSGLAIVGEAGLGWSF